MTDIVPLDCLVDGVTKKLWVAKVLEKMKFTIWRFLHNYVPTKVDLFQFRLGSDRMCPRCGGGPETLLHAYRDCLELLELWGKLGISWGFVPADDDTL